LSFYSILYRSPDDFITPPDEAPEFFRDLHFDQIVDAVTHDWKEYNLAPFFFSPLQDLDAVAYRQEVMRDFENTALRQASARSPDRCEAYVMVWNTVSFRQGCMTWTERAG
jgi:hypothetical protein